MPRLTSQGSRPGTMGEVLKCRFFSDFVSFRFAATCLQATLGIKAIAIECMIPGQVAPTERGRQGRARVRKGQLGSEVGYRWL